MPCAPSPRVPAVTYLGIHISVSLVEHWWSPPSYAHRLISGSAGWVICRCVHGKMLLAISASEETAHCALQALPVQWCVHIVDSSCCASWFICRCIPHLFWGCTFSCSQSTIVASSPCALATASLHYLWRCFLVLLHSDSSAVNVRNRGCCDSSSGVTHFNDLHSTKD